MRRFASDKDSTAASEKPPPPPPPLPLPLLPPWAGNPSATSDGADGGDEHSSGGEGSSTRSRASSTRLVGATGGDATGHSQRSPVPDGGLPSSCDGGSPATESSYSSSYASSLPLALRKYAKKLQRVREARATIAPPPTPSQFTPKIESEGPASPAATEDRALPWINTAVAAARNMTKTIAAIPITTPTTAATRFRSRWG